MIKKPFKFLDELLLFSSGLFSYFILGLSLKMSFINIGFVALASAFSMLRQREETGIL